MQSFQAAIEDRFADALDEKYHPQEYRNMLIEQEEFSLNEDPRKDWLTNKGKFANVNDE